MCVCRLVKVAVLLSRVSVPSVMSLKWIPYVPFRPGMCNT